VVPCDGDALNFGGLCSRTIKACRGGGSGCLRGAISGWGTGQPASFACRPTAGQKAGPRPRGPWRGSGREATGPTRWPGMRKSAYWGCGYFLGCPSGETVWGLGGECRLGRWPRARGVAGAVGTWTGLSKDGRRLMTAGAPPVAGSGDPKGRR